MSKKLIKPDSFVVGDVWEMASNAEHNFAGYCFVVSIVSYASCVAQCGGVSAHVDKWRIERNLLTLISREGCIVVDGMIVVDEEGVAFPQMLSEAEVVKEWIGKARWLCKNTVIDVCIDVNNESNEWLDDQYVADFVINSYNSYKKKESEKKKQELLDKKLQLELELAQINKELGEEQ